MVESGNDCYDNKGECQGKNDFQDTRALTRASELLFNVLFCFVHVFTSPQEYHRRTMKVKGFMKINEDSFTSTPYLSL